MAEAEAMGAFVSSRLPGGGRYGHKRRLISYGAGNTQGPETGLKVLNNKSQNKLGLLYSTNSEVAPLR